MKIRFLHIVVLLIVMLIIHIVANLTGMYVPPGIWVDKLLHIMAGVAVGMIWIIFLQRKGLSRSNLVECMSIIGFVAITAVMWEFSEYIFWNIFPIYAEKWNLYSPNIKDVLSDITANLVGGILLGWAAVKNTK